MQLLFKQEKEMDEEEKVKLTLMRALSVIFNPKDSNKICDENLNFDFTSSSQKFVQASLLMDFFDIKIKESNLLKYNYPEKYCTFPSQLEFEKRYVPKTKEVMKIKADYINEVLAIMDDYEVLSNDGKRPSKGEVIEKPKKTKKTDEGSK